MARLMKRRRDSESQTPSDDPSKKRCPLRRCLPSRPGSARSEKSIQSIEGGVMNPTSTHSSSSDKLPQMCPSYKPFQRLQDASLTSSTRAIAACSSKPQTITFQHRFESDSFYTQSPIASASVQSFGNVAACIGEHMKDYSISAATPDNSSPETSDPGNLLLWRLNATARRGSDFFKGRRATAPAAYPAKRKSRIFHPWTIAAH